MYEALRPGTHTMNNENRPEYSNAVPPIIKSHLKKTVVFTGLTPKVGMQFGHIGRVTKYKHPDPSQKHSFYGSGVTLSTHAVTNLG